MAREGAGAVPEDPLGEAWRRWSALLRHAVGACKDRRIGICPGFGAPPRRVSARHCGGLHLTSANA